MKTDAQLQQDVIAELAWEPAVKATRIGVATRNGIVTLSGHVDSYAEKRHAEQAAQRVTGVKGVAVEIDVQLPGISKRTDADIARSASNVLAWTTNLPRGAIKVLSENGWLTLSGDVEWDYQRRLAKGAVLNLLGVVGVSDSIVVKPKASTVAVRSGIEFALQRRAQDDAQRVQVDIDGGDVTLSGTVHSWSERELAMRSAWSAPGVRTVVNNISIAP
jgi:osmotically-inducible protein OsmY